jgi:hypothetical protein
MINRDDIDPDLNITPNGFYVKKTVQGRVNRGNAATERRFMVFSYKCSPGPAGMLLRKLTGGYLYPNDMKRGGDTE